MAGSQVVLEHLLSMQANTYVHAWAPDWLWLCSQAKEWLGTMLLSKYHLVPQDLIITLYK